jgi:hypothetical protein
VFVLELIISLVANAVVGFQIGAVGDYVLNWLSKQKVLSSASEFFFRVHVLDADREKLPLPNIENQRELLQAIVQAGAEDPFHGKAMGMSDAE